MRSRTETGGELVLGRDYPQPYHLDHAYSSTVRGAQGATIDRAIAVTESDRRALTDLADLPRRARARDSLVVLTGDRETLIETLETATGEDFIISHSSGYRPNSTIPIHLVLILALNKNLP